MCAFEQRGIEPDYTLGAMELQHIKMTIAALWVLTAVVMAIAIELSWTGRIAIATFGLLPPLAILLLWNDPAPTMSESIRDARR